MLKTLEISTRYFCGQGTMGWVFCKAGRFTLCLKRSKLPNYSKLTFRSYETRARNF